MLAKNNPILKTGSDSTIEIESSFQIEVAALVSEKIKDA